MMDVDLRCGRADKRVNELASMYPFPSIHHLSSQTSLGLPDRAVMGSSTTPQSYYNCRVTDGMSAFKTGPHLLVKMFQGEQSWSEGFLADVVRPPCLCQTLITHDTP